MSANIKGILEYALSKEREGMNFYNSKIDTVISKDVKEAFEMLGKMEEGHVDYILDLIEDVSNEKALRFEDDDSNLFETRAEKEIVYHGDFSSVKVDMPILRMAYLIEEDFMHFYLKSVDSVTDPDTKKILNRLADWEMNHAKLVKSLYEESAKVFWENQKAEPLDYYH
ncbi:MAG TPA: ferritin family protein [Tepiditoga sp.]|nr:ferritin family protein [Tepiditoga sp.]